MTSPPEAPAAGFAFLEGRLRTAVQVAAAADQSPDDSLRGLYISDEQALSLAAGAAAVDADARMADRRRAARASTRSTPPCSRSAPRPSCTPATAASTPTCRTTSRAGSPARAWRPTCSPARASSAPTCSPASPPARRSSASGAIRLMLPDAPTPLADRPVKVSDRLAAFLLGADHHLGDAGAPIPLRRADPHPIASGREEAVAEVSAPARRRDAPAAGRVRPGRRRDRRRRGRGAADPPRRARPRARRGDGRRDARRRARGAPALPRRARRPQAGRARSACCGRSTSAPSARSCIGRSRGEALALSDRTALLVDVPMPSFAERKAAWQQFSGAEDPPTSRPSSASRSTRSARPARSAGSPRAAPAASSPTPRTSTSAAATPRRRGSASSPPGSTPPTAGTTSCCPSASATCCSSISAYLRHRDRVLSEWGYERTVARTQGLKVLFAGESGTGKTMAAQVLAARARPGALPRRPRDGRLQVHRGDREEPRADLHAPPTAPTRSCSSTRPTRCSASARRSPTRHDRYANIEVAYLLQRMEAYPGAVILATNFRRNIDDAFIRRLDFVVDFPFPEADDRKRIWRLVLPEQAPVAERRRPRVPRHAVQALRRRDPQLLAGRRVPGGRRGRADRDAPPRARGRAGVRQAGPPHARGRLRALPRARSSPWE